MIVPITAPALAFVSIAIGAWRRFRRPFSSFVELSHEFANLLPAHVVLTAEVPLRVVLQCGVAAYDGAADLAHHLEPVLRVQLLGVRFHVLLHGGSNIVGFLYQLLASVDVSRLAGLLARSHLIVDLRLPAHLALGDLHVEPHRVTVELFLRLAHAFVAPRDELDA